MKAFLFALFVLMISSVVQAQNTDFAKISLLTYGGIPKKEKDTSNLKLLINTGYIAGYDDSLMNPIWVAYRLGNMKGPFEYKNWERPDRFIPDYRTRSKVGHDALSGSGYDRGHMAPSATLVSQYGQIGQLETYLMSNICPQTPALNQRLWAELEKIEREQISQDDTPSKEVHELFVLTGPIFKEGPAKLSSGVAIPWGFYRILAFRKGYLGTIKAVAYIIPQIPGSSSLNDYLSTTDKVEEMTGLNFFPELSTIIQRNLESKKRRLDLAEF